MQQCPEQDCAMRHRHVPLPRRFVSTDCFLRRNGKTSRIARPGKIAQRYREIAAGAAVFLALPPADLPFYPFVFLLYGNPFANGSARRDMLFRCKGIALEEHSSTATLFEHNFQQLSRFSIVHISRTLNTAAIKFCPNSLPVSP